MKRSFYLPLLAITFLIFSAGIGFSLNYIMAKFEHKKEIYKEETTVADISIPLGP